MRGTLTAILLIGLFSSMTFTPSKALQFEKSEYAARRGKMMEKFPDGPIIVLGATSLAGYYTFMQNNDFLYLTGVEAENAILVIDPVNKTSILFANGVTGSGIEQVRKPGDFNDFLTQKLGDSQTFYTCFQPEELARECEGEKKWSIQSTMTNNPWDSRLTREMQFVEKLRSKFPKATVKDCSGFIAELRTIKSPAEIDLMRKAARIAVRAHMDVMKATMPGVKEQELAALFEYSCKQQGAGELAYYTIICSDTNHADLHHHTYERTLADGDFLVIDAGPDLHNYDIDITISYPANGRFTPRQREIYEACNAVHEACMQTYRPGLTTQQCNEEIRAILKKKGFDPDSELVKSFGGGFGHYVGMAVHDVGGGPTVLKAGMVFANEPLAVFAREKLGVRIEDTVVITDTGCENLTKGIPRTVAEIEAFMKK